MAFSILFLFLAVPWVGLQYVIVAFPGHTQVFFHSPTCLMYMMSQLLRDPKKHRLQLIYVTTVA